jgi:putative membrane protein
MTWNFELSLILGIALLVVLYAWSATRYRSRHHGAQPLSRVQVVFFSLALLSLVVALVSPIDDLADHDLLSMHMVQHLLLTLVMPPLLLLSTPGWMLRPLLNVPLALPILRRLTSPVAAFLVFNGVFCAWHVPALYELTLQNESVHIFEHLLFMATAFLAWMPIVSPLPELPRLPYPAMVLYLFLQSVVPTVLGGLITFADDVLYPTYAHAPRVWGMSALEDQQWGGLIMWIPGAFVYLTALTVVWFVWFEGKEKVGEIR